MKKTKYHPESGEEARKRKKKAMNEHAIKLHDAIRGRLPGTTQTGQ